MINRRMFDPFYVLDLYHDVGGKNDPHRPASEKMLPLAVVVAAIWLHALGKPFDTLELVTLGAIAFGPRLFGMWLSHVQFTASQQTNVSVDAAAVAHEVMARRAAGKATASEDTP